MSTDNFNADELVAPSFITEALIESVIKNQEDDPYAHVSILRFIMISFVNITRCQF